VISVIFLLTANFSGAREKTDVITLVNGDRITGEVRQLALGKVTVKTDAIGTISIEWDKVKTLQSTQVFEVENDDGTKYYGFITPADEEGRFLVLSSSGPVIALKHDLIVRIESIEDTWRNRWRGFVDLGFSYLSANSALSLTLASEATYRSKKFKWHSALTSVVSDRDDAARTSWTTMTNSYTRYHSDRWYGIGFQRYEANEESQLDRRFTLGGGIGRHVIQTNRSQLGLVGGLSANREQYSTEIEPQSETESNANAWTAEAVLAATYDFFVFGDDETRLSTSLAILPNISQWGRYRIEVGSSLRHEFFSDFTLNLSFFDTYDSEPPVQDAEKNDIRIQTTLGWTF